jgi:hypothetical protein
MTSLLELSDSPLQADDKPLRSRCAPHLYRDYLSAILNNISNISSGSNRHTDFSKLPKNKINVDLEYKLLYTQSAIIFFLTKIIDNLGKSNRCENFYP